MAFRSDFIAPLIPIAITCPANRALSAMPSTISCERPRRKFEYDNEFAEYHIAFE